VISTKFMIVDLRYVDRLPAQTVMVVRLRSQSIDEIYHTYVGSGQ